MNKFLSGLVEYWDNEAAMSGSEMERSAYEHGEDGKDAEVSFGPESFELNFLSRKKLIPLLLALKWMQKQSLLLLIFPLKKKKMTMKFLLNQNQQFKGD